VYKSKKQSINETVSWNQLKLEGDGVAVVGNIKRTYNIGLTYGSLLLHLI
jgi:hypothetical protein